jgi:transposase
VVTVPLETEAEIRRLFFAEHWKIGTVEAELGVHADVVRRVAGLLSDKRVLPLPQPRKVEPFVAFIDETLARHPRLRATRLYDMLRPRGYTGSVSTLREHVALVRPAPRSEVFLRTEPMVGEQAQIDWAYVGPREVPGGQRALWIFVMVLASSRAMWGEFVWDLSAWSLRRSLVRATNYFGGTTRQWLFDNPRTIVLERHGDAVRFHPMLLELAGQMHVQPRLCGVRKPQQKGRVERAVRYLRERLLAGRNILDVASGNRVMLEFLEQIAHRRPHPVHRDRSVADLFAEERARLLPLPSPRPELDQIVPVTADKTAFVHFDTNLYSVPSVYGRRALTLVADDTRVRLLDGEEEVARHDRSWGRRQRVESYQHRLEILADKRRARDLKGRDRLHAIVPEIDVLMARWVAAGRNVGSMVGRTIHLLDLYGDTLLAQAVTELVARGTHDPGALAILCEQRRREADKPVPLEVLLGDHVPDRDVVPHDLGGYDARR